MQADHADHNLNGLYQNFSYTLRKFNIRSHATFHIKKIRIWSLLSCCYYFQKHSLNTRISIHSKVLLTDSIFETGAKVTVGMFTNYRLQIFILAMAPIAIKPFLWGKITSKIVYFKAWNINRFFLFLPIKALWAYSEMLKWPQLQSNPFCVAK